MDIQTVLNAIADPTRRRVLEAVRQGPRRVTDIARDFEVSRPAVSQHLKVLMAAGLVQLRKSGRDNFYAVDPAGLLALRSYFEDFWDDVLDAFQMAAVKEAIEKRKRA